VSEFLPGAGPPEKGGILSPQRLEEELLKANRRSDMKRKPMGNDPPPAAKPKARKDQGAVPARAKQLLKKGNRKQRAVLSPSQLHSKTFGH
jgi:hypothetical protein